MQQKNLKIKRKPIHYDSFTIRKIRKMNSLPSWVLVLSFIILCLLGTMNGGSQSKGGKKENTKMVSVKIQPSKTEKAHKKDVPAKLKPKPKTLLSKMPEGFKAKKLSKRPGKDKANKLPKKTKSIKQKTKPKSRKSVSKKFTTRELVELGKKYMDKVSRGDFPTMTLSYVNPISYINAMYALGAMSIVITDRAANFSTWTLLMETCFLLTGMNFMDSPFLNALSRTNNGRNKNSGLLPD